ncbi:MAG: ABC transporter permease [Alphaproteobacteria bacterium]|nr:ABC transporter permease [Alphaproteobacteria bacterium]MDE2630441.1 ABC transporter permease [Alphaproteobacteria bacterium]
MGTNEATDTDTRPWIQVTRRVRTLHLSAGGSWTARHAATLDPQLQAIDVDGFSEAEIDGGEIDRLDSSGGWLLVRTKKRLEGSGLRVVLFRIAQRYAPLLAVIEAEHVVMPVEFEENGTLAALLERVGRGSHMVLLQAAGILGYLGHVTLEWFKTVYAPRGHLRVTALVHQIEEAGINALPIVGLLLFLIGIVLAYLGIDQLRRFGAENLTVNILGAGLLREVGVLITAIVIAGRSGSAFTAQIGTMKVNEELDAMQTIGLNVVDVLILPRVVGLVIALPFLTLYADVMGLIGGATMCYFDLGMTIPAFMRQLHQAVTVNTFMVGLIKAPVFAYIIGMVGCYEGMNVERNAGSVGKLTTRSVVESIFLVIVIDAGFAVLFSILGI